MTYITGTLIPLNDGYVVLYIRNNRIESIKSIIVKPQAVDGKVVDQQDRLELSQKEI